MGLKHRLDKLDRATAPLDRRGLVPDPDPWVIPWPEGVPPGPPDPIVYIDPAGPNLVIPREDDRPDWDEATYRAAFEAAMARADGPDRV